MFAALAVDFGAEIIICYSPQLIFLQISDCWPVWVKHGWMLFVFVPVVGYIVIIESVLSIQKNLFPYSN